MRRSAVPASCFDTGERIKVRVRSGGGRLSEQTLPSYKGRGVPAVLECNELTRVFKVRLTRQVFLLETGKCFCLLDAITVS